MLACKLISGETGDCLPFTIDINNPALQIQLHHHHRHLIEQARVPKLAIQRSLLCTCRQ